MNYALDALWWRLQNPQVRALASILTAPALWHTGQELSVRELLGEHGFRLLLQWDDTHFRLPENTHSRLGHYAEDLLAFWLTHAPHSRLMARDVRIASANKTLGALDFVAELSGCVYHIELCCKYYGDATGQPENMVGLNREDTLQRKQHKLAQQLQLSGCPEAQSRWTDWGVDSQSVQRVSVVRGMGFTHSGSLKQGCYPTNAWSGVLIDDVAQWQQFDADALFYPLARSEYLAPAHVAPSAISSLKEVMTMGQGLYAQVVQRPDGFYHEIQRVMCRVGG